MAEQHETLISLDQPHLTVGEAQRGEPMPEALGEIDPVLHRLQEAPYDPVATYQAGGLLIGLAATQTRFRGWMRPVGYLLALALVSNLGFVFRSAITAYRDSGTGFEQAFIAAAPGALFGMAMGLAGVLLLWRLISTRSQDGSSNLNSTREGQPTT